MDIRGLLRNFGLKVGTIGAFKFAELTRELVEAASDLARSSIADWEYFCPHSQLLELGVLETRSTLGVR